MELFAVGFFIGIVSGLLPGMHPNMIIAVLASLGMSGDDLGLMIIALYPAWMMTSFIPSIFFGMPDRSTIVSMLPGQRMVLRGEGLSALKTILLSSIAAVLLSIALYPLSLWIYPIAYEAIRSWMGYIVAGASILLFLRSKSPLRSLVFFTLSGMLGFFTLNSGMEDPFLPLFSGMFALAAIANYRKGSVPEQRDEPIGGPDARFVAAGVVLGMAASLIPGIGSPAQVATFATVFMAMDTLAYLALISSIAVSQSVFSLSTSASIGKSRVGAIVWLAGATDIAGNQQSLLVLFMLSMALAAALIFMMRRKIGKLAEMDLSGLNAMLALYLIAITFIIDGLPGLAVLLISCGIGWLAIRTNTERTSLMGSIIFPTLLLLFRIF